MTAGRRGVGSPFCRCSSFLSDFVSWFFPCCLSFLGSVSCWGSSGFGSSCARRDVTVAKSRIAKQIKEVEYIFRIVQPFGARRSNTLGDRFFSGVLHGDLLGALRILNLVQFCISSSGCKKFLMSASFDKLRILEHKNTVRVANGS